MEMILPGAQSIFEQIEVFRNNANEICDAEQENEQRINNIGIMGCRGAGKTSVLRSFYQNLKAESQKNGDVVLPIIVPENMSASATLMDVVLGTLKSEVEAVKEERKQQKSGDCIYNGRDKLEKEYNEMVKKYCYIKKDYRDILMQQFTTEQYYVDKTKEVFNSDTEFITLFRKFIETLLEKKKADSKGMVFLFIDDIDLSTTRCMDVVRTLLSYLSNPRIVTMISGDLETFEEALTLEFLRQEEALDAETMEKTYYSVSENAKDNNLLERKKKMAYEYLKKIVPPAYRKTIKYWSLGDRGSYQIAQEDEKQPSLAELLVKVTGEYVGKSYFMSAGGENFAVSYHLFDDTSRGLNNVYNVLLELAEESECTDRTVGFWRLIETMIDSKVLYAKYRMQILERVLVRTKESVRVDFFSVHTLLYGKEVAIDENTSKTDGDDMTMQAEKGFSIFLLADFTARLFGQKIEEDENYNALKNRVVKEYLRNEAIDGKIAEPRNFIDLNREIPKDVYKRMLPIQRVLAELLLNGGFIFDIYLIMYLGRTEIYTILNDIGKIEDKSERWAIYNVASALMRVIEAMGENEEEQKKYLASLYLRMQDTLMNLLDLLPQDAKVVYGASLVQKTSMLKQIEHWDNNSSDVADAGFYNVKCYLRTRDKMKKISDSDFLWAFENLLKIQYWIYFELHMRENKRGGISFDIARVTEELIYRGLTKTLMKQLESVIGKEGVKKLNAENYKISNEQDEKRKMEVICKIDEKNMWRHEYVTQNVKKFLDKKRTEYFNNATEGRILFDMGELLEEGGAYRQFADCKTGTSKTALVIGLQKKLKEFLGLGNEEKTENVYLCLEQVLVIECTLEEFLKNHSRIQYGKWETRRFLMAMKELPLVLHTDTVDWNEKMKAFQKRERVFLGEPQTTRKLLQEHHLQEDDIADIQKEIFKDKSSDTFGGFLLDSSKRKLQTVDEYERDIINKYIEKKNFSDDKKIRYDIEYMVYKEELDNLWQTVEKTDGQTIEEWEEEQWENRETPIPEQQLRFYLHSYLRYLQANDKDAQHAGELADSVAKFTEYVFESGKVADKQTQSEFFAMVGEELGISEEEFETLFNS